MVFFMGDMTWTRRQQMARDCNGNAAVNHSESHNHCRWLVVSVLLYIEYIFRECIWPHIGQAMYLYCCLYPSNFAFCFRHILWFIPCVSVHVDTENVQYVLVPKPIWQFGLN